MLRPTTGVRRTRSRLMGSWSPLRVLVGPEDVPRERVEAAAPDGGVSPTLLGRATVLQQVVSSLLVGRVLVESGLDVVARMHPAGVMYLEHVESDRTTRGFVVAAVSSMEPRPIWPMLLPLSVLEVAPIDWIAACSVPKMPALESIEHAPADAYVLGWLPAADLTKLPIVTLEPHFGHDFEGQYRQAKNHQLRPIDTFPG